MHRFVVSAMVFSLASLDSIAQNTIALAFIDDYPIKIDAECNFYIFDSTQIESNRFVFIVSGNKTGFFKRNGKFIYVDHIERKRMDIQWVFRRSFTEFSTIECTKYYMQETLSGEILSGYVLLQSGWKISCPK